LWVYLFQANTPPSCTEDDFLQLLFLMITWQYPIYNAHGLMNIATKNLVICVYRFCLSVSFMGRTSLCYSCFVFFQIIWLSDRHSGSLLSLKLSELVLFAWIVNRFYVLSCLNVLLLDLKLIFSESQESEWVRAVVWLYMLRT